MAPKGMNELLTLVDWDKATWVGEERYLKPRYRGFHTRCCFCGDRFKSGEWRQQIAVPWSEYAHQRCIPYRLPPDPNVIRIAFVTKAVTTLHAIYHPLTWPRKAGEPKDGP